MWPFAKSVYFHAVVVAATRTGKFAIVPETFVLSMVIFWRYGQETLYQFDVEAISGPTDVAFAFAKSREADCVKTGEAGAAAVVSSG
jgi:hypothetical protein